MGGTRWSVLFLLFHHLVSVLNITATRTGKWLSASPCTELKSVLFVRDVAHRFKFHYGTGSENCIGCFISAHFCHSTKVNGIWPRLIWLKLLFASCSFHLIKVSIVSLCAFMKMQKIWVHALLKFRHWFTPSTKHPAADRI